MLTTPVLAVQDKTLAKFDLAVDSLAISSPHAHAALPSLQSILGPLNWLVENDEPSHLLLSLATAVTGPFHSSLLPLSPMSRVAQHKAIAKKTARRSLWKCRRRKLSMKDLLCSEPARDTKLERSSRASHRRQCGMQDCAKYALSGGFCIAHGGGKKCRHEFCDTVAQSGGLCKAHGGGSKCKSAGCSSVARRMGFCMAHGGRQPCKVAGCGKCAHGGGFCIAHGGGKRCASLDCTKSAQAGGFCYSHGGGKRCTAPECFQAARKGGRCIRHREDADDEAV